jgi:hypothetical protein
VQTASEGTLLDECRIVGTGERSTYSKEQPELDVFGSLEARTAAFVIAAPQRAHVTWSHFPARVDAHGRARVELGGQEHIRWSGYALLKGRTFSTRQRMVAEHGHIWARAGAPVEMLAVEEGVAIVEVGTPFVSPKELRVRGACSALAYEPEEPEHPTPKPRQSDEVVVSQDVALDLFASPSDPRPFTTITTEDAHGIAMDVMEKQGGFMRVAADIDDVGFDAWVRTSDVTGEDVGTGIGLSGFGTSSRCGGSGIVQEGVIRRDTPLFVGVVPAALAAAVVEKNADVYFWSSDEIMDDKALVSFVFADAMITPSGDARFWVAKDDVAPK